MNKTEVIALIRSVLSSTTASPTVASLNNDFKKETGIDIPLFGYRKLNDFLFSIPDTVKITGSYPLQRVSLVENEKSSHIVSLVKRQKISGPKNNRIFKTKSFSINKRQKIRMIKPQPNIFNSNLGHKKFSVTPPSNVIEINLIPNFNEVVEEPQTTPSAAERNAAADSDLNLSVLSPVVQGDFSLFKFMVLNETIPVINVRLHAPMHQYIEVCPCHIKNPHLFFFHFRKFKNIFKVLVKKLNKFYLAKKGDVPALPERLVRPGQLCIVPWKIKDKPLWSRAEIIKIINKSEVVVSLFDYGNTAVIEKANLKIFHRGFLSVPKQAVQGYLANIKPLTRDSKWSSKATRRFKYFALGNDLIGGVVDIDTSAKNDSDRIGLALSETKDAEIHINDTLVKEGYAEFDFQEEESSMNWCDILCKKTSHAENFIDNLIENSNKKYLESEILKPQKLSPEHTQVFYFSSIFNENNRLRKLFNVAADN